MARWVNVKVKRSSYRCDSLQIAGPRYKSDVPGLTEEESTAAPRCCCETRRQQWMDR